MPATAVHRPPINRRAFTLVEMLVAMAITLVMMGAVVTLFANVSNSVRNRRAVVELNGQLRHVRNMLQRDLQGATCAGLVWQRPEENQGYIEIVEGPYRESNPSLLTDGIGPTASIPRPENPEIDYTLSFIPSNNIAGDYNNDGRVDDRDRDAHFGRWNCYLVRQDPNGPNDDAANAYVTSSSGLGDADDILMLTVRNEHEPFVGRVPASDTTSDDRSSRVRPNDDIANRFGNWDSETIRSPLAEVVWYAVENPGYTGDNSIDGDTVAYFGEPGLRTIYRRTLLIAPWINPYRYIRANGEVVDTFEINGSGPTFVAKPGLVRILPANVDRDEAEQALAALIAFQEAYDLSVRLEFDPMLDPDPDPETGGRWKIVANTLGDLTKRENRYEHHAFRPDEGREYPFAVVSIGSEYNDNNVALVIDPELGGGNAARATANLEDYDTIDDTVATYSIDPLNLTDPNRRYVVRPFAYVDADSATLATARVMLNDEGEVIRVVHGLVPLSGDRRGEDVMMTDALGFDIRVYDPGAPLFVHNATKTVLDPTDTAWTTAYMSDDHMDNGGTNGAIGNDDDVYQFVEQGAYVDLGYGYDVRRLRHNPSRLAVLPAPVFNGPYLPAIEPWFFAARGLRDVFGKTLAPGYAVFDTWSFHYENNGLNEDDDEVEVIGGIPTGQVDDGNGMGMPSIDEGTNGIDDFGHYADATEPELRLGPDDVGERETVPPYDRPLRSVQVVLRLYERDSRQMRQVRVNQSFVPE